MSQVFPALFALTIKCAARWLDYVMDPRQEVKVTQRGADGVDDWGLQPV